MSNTIPLTRLPFLPQMENFERLVAEQQNLRKNRKFLFYALPITSPKNKIIWECGFPGPDIEPYCGSFYTVNVSFPPNYPKAPPIVQFIHPVYHPNVYSDGKVCLDIIASKWKPSMNVMSVLSGLQHFLEYPNIKSPANVEAGQKYRKNRKEYDKLVTENIKMYHSKPKYRTM